MPTLRELIEQAGGNLSPDQIIARIAQASKAVQTAGGPVTSPAPFTPAPPQAPRYTPPPVPVPTPQATPVPGAPRPSVGLPNLGALGDLLNRVLPRQNYINAQPGVMPYASGARPVQPTGGLPGTQVANIGATQLQRTLASPGVQIPALAAQYGTQPAAPPGLTNLPYVGPAIRTATTPATWTFGPELGAQFSLGALAGGVPGRMIGGAKGERIGAGVGEAALPLAIPAVRAAAGIAPEALSSYMGRQDIHPLVRQELRLIEPEITRYGGTTEELAATGRFSELQDAIKYRDSLRYGSNEWEMANARVAKEADIARTLERRFPTVQGMAEEAAAVPPAEDSVASVPGNLPPESPDVPLALPEGKRIAGLLAPVEPPRRIRLTGRLGGDLDLMAEATDLPPGLVAERAREVGSLAAGYRRGEDLLARAMQVDTDGIKKQYKMTKDEVGQVMRWLTEVQDIDTMVAARSGTQWTIPGETPTEGQTALFRYVRDYQAKRVAQESAAGLWGERALTEEPYAYLRWLPPGVEDGEVASAKSGGVRRRVADFQEAAVFKKGDKPIDIGESLGYTLEFDDPVQSEVYRSIMGGKAGAAKILSDWLTRNGLVRDSIEELGAEAKNWERSLLPGDGGKFVPKSVNDVYRHVGNVSWMRDPKTGRTASVAKFLLGTVQDMKQALFSLSGFQEMDYSRRTLLSALADTVSVRRARAQGVRGFVDPTLIPKAGKELALDTWGLFYKPAGDARLAAKAAQMVEANKYGLVLEAPPDMQRALMTTADEVVRTGLPLVGRIPGVAKVGAIGGKFNPAYLTASINHYIRDGLFERMFIPLKYWAWENIFVPRQIVANEGKGIALDELKRIAADDANAAMGSLDYTKVFSGIVDPGVMDVAKMASISADESIMWPRQFFRPLFSKDKSFWLKYWGGFYLSMAAIANVGNMVTRGRPLDKDQYSPFVIRDGKVRYNSNWLAIQMPLELTEGALTFIDPLGQVATPFRLVDPVRYVYNRFSPPLRATADLARNRDYRGRMIVKGGEPLQRAGDLLKYVLSTVSPAGLEPALHGESVASEAVTGIGLETRPASPSVEQEEIARQLGYPKRSDLTPVQKQELIAKSPRYAELEGDRTNRLEERAAAGEEPAIVSVGIMHARQRRDDRIQDVALPALANGDIENFRTELEAARDGYTQDMITLKAEHADQFGKLDELYEGATSQELVDLHGMFDIFGKYEGDNGIVPPEFKADLGRDLDAYISGLPEDRQAALNANLGARDTPILAERRKDMNLLGQEMKVGTANYSYFNVDDKIWEEVRADSPELAPYETADDFRQLIARDAVAKGNDIADRLGKNAYWSRYTTWTSNAQAALIDAHPEVGAAAMLWFGKNIRKDQEKKVRPVFQQRLQQILEATSQP